MEHSKEFSMYFDASVREDSVLTSLKKMELNMSQVDQRIGSLTQERDQVISEIVRCLKEAGVEDIEDIDQTNFEGVLDKLKQLLQNYDEDRRQLQALLADNE